MSGNRTPGAFECLNVHAIWPDDVGGMQNDELSMSGVRLALQATVPKPEVDGWVFALCKPESVPWIISTMAACSLFSTRLLFMTDAMHTSDGYG